MAGQSLNLLSISLSFMKTEPMVPSNLTFPQSTPTSPATFSASFGETLSSPKTFCPNMVLKSIPLLPNSAFAFSHSNPERHVAIIVVWLSWATRNRCSKFCCSTNLCRSSITNIFDRQNFRCLGKRNFSRSMSVDLATRTSQGLFNFFRASKAALVLPLSGGPTIRTLRRPDRLSRIKSSSSLL